MIQLRHQRYVYWVFITVVTLLFTVALSHTVSADAVTGETVVTLGEDLTEAQKEQILNEMAVKLKENRLEEYPMLNRQFHDMIYAASKNKQAVQMIHTIKTQLNRIHFKTILIPGRSEASYREHKEILTAIKARNEGALERAVRRHVANVRLAIVDHYHILV